MLAFRSAVAREKHALAWLQNPTFAPGGGPDQDRCIRNLHAAVSSAGGVTPERLPMLSGVGVNVERAFIKRGPFINGAAWRVAGACPREPTMFYLHVCLFFVFEAPGAGKWRRSINSSRRAERCVCASSYQMFFFFPCSVFPPLYLPLTLSFCLHSHCIHQILDSVSYTHQHDIVHRDLKVCVRVSLICICVCLSAASPAGGALRGWKGGLLFSCLCSMTFFLSFFSFSCL